MSEKVFLAPPDLQWPLQFEIEKEKILRALRRRGLPIEHFGSTAIPGLRAKPVIDILVGCKSMAEADKLIPLLCAIGYETSARFNAKIGDRRFLRKRRNRIRTHHVHLVVHKTAKWRERLRFRDILRANRSIAKRYEKLKIGLARIHRDDREAYTDAKAIFIKGILRPVSMVPVAARRKKEFLTLARSSRAFHKPWVRAPVTEKEFAAYLARTRRPDMQAYFLCRAHDQALVGVINISQIFHGKFRSAYLGYYVFAPFARAGHMEAGLSLALRQAFGNLKLHRLEANIQPGNTASKKLVEKLGFRREGFSPGYLKVLGAWRDHERWAITKEEWK